MRRFRGRAAQDTRVDAVVIATLSARSALQTLHQKPLKPPLGLVVITSSVTAVTDGWGISQSTQT